MMMGVHDVANRLIGNRPHLGHDAIEIHLELVVNDQHAVVGDEDGGVAGHERIVQHVKVVGELHDRELGRCRTELPMHVGAAQCDTKREGEGNAFRHAREYRSLHTDRAGTQDTLRVPRLGPPVSVWPTSRCNHCFAFSAADHRSGLECRVAALAVRRLSLLRVRQSQEVARCPITVDSSALACCSPWL